MFLRVFSFTNYLSPAPSHVPMAWGVTPHTICSANANSGGRRSGGGRREQRWWQHQQQGARDERCETSQPFFFLFFHYFHLLLGRLCAWPLPPHTVAPSTTAAMTPPNTTVKPVATSPPVRTLMTTNRAQARVSFSFFFFFSYFTNMYLL